MMRSAAHPCRSGCGRLRPRFSMDFCRTCFDRIPRDIRQRMRDARDAKAPHLVARAVSDAMTWLREHPLTSAGRGAVE